MLLRILYRGQMTVCAYFLLCCFDQSSRMNEIKATVLKFCAFLDAHSSCRFTVLCFDLA
jgi:putative component of toxin-antitoxin plasmid stabilization module